ncbi:hypothetical protein [Hymenobacter sp. YC55]|uniref:hypothetical protein n=1 Tax=Hymenobacter sp. YC55 TaxID=3034019 RepID=UPI0023F6B3AE|nr:hypothetical protein [Hymenobacter sp. YC55]MDF7815341.1 hypothetical protein [Hymenobacter sp. YC55]
MSLTAPAAFPLESLRETTYGLELAVIAYTKGQLSQEELRAEIDWAATAYEAAGLNATSTRARYAELIAE